jgi:hypothetical protein
MDTAMKRALLIPIYKIFRLHRQNRKLVTALLSCYKKIEPDQGLMDFMGNSDVFFLILLKKLIIYPLLKVIRSTFYKVRK